MSDFVSHFLAGRAPSVGKPTSSPLSGKSTPLQRGNPPSQVVLRGKAQDDKKQILHMRGKRLDQNDKTYLSRQMTTDFANRIPIEILRSGTLASKFSRLYCIMGESIFQSFSKKRLNRWLSLPIPSAATFFRRRSFYSFKHEKCLYRSINAYFCFRLSIRRSISP